MSTRSDLLRMLVNRFSATTAIVSTISPSVRPARRAAAALASADDPRRFRSISSFESPARRPIAVWAER